MNRENAKKYKIAGIFYVSLAILIGTFQYLKGIFYIHVRFINSFNLGVLNSTFGYTAIIIAGSSLIIKKLKLRQLQGVFREDLINSVMVVGLTTSLAFLILSIPITSNLPISLFNPDYQYLIYLIYTLVYFAITVGLMYGTVFFDRLIKNKFPNLTADIRIWEIFLLLFFVLIFFVTDRVNYWTTWYEFLKSQSNLLRGLIPVPLTIVIVVYIIIIFILYAREIFIEPFISDKQKTISPVVPRTNPTTTQPIIPPVTKTQPTTSVPPANTYTPLPKTFQQIRGLNR